MGKETRGIHSLAALSSCP